MSVLQQYCAVLAEDKRHVDGGEKVMSPAPHLCEHVCLSGTPQASEFMGMPEGAQHTITKPRPAATRPGCGNSHPPSTAELPYTIRLLEVLRSWRLLNRLPPAFLFPQDMICG